MTVIVKHSKTNAISDWTQAQLDEQIALGNFAPGTTLAQIVLPSDWNNDHTLTGVGTMAEQDANNVAITGGTINGTTIGATTATTGVFTTLTSTGQTFLGGISGSDVVRVYKDNTIAGTTASFTAPALSFIPPQSGFGASILRSSTQLNITTGSTTPIVLQTASTLGFAGTEQARVSHTASAVNYVQVTGAATGGNPTISMQGSDTNISTGYISKGTGQHIFASNGTINNQQFRILNTASTVNYPTVTGSVTTNAVPFSVAGTDTNISMAFQPKGTGAINLAAGSSGVNISNGGTVTAITRTASNTNYTSIPSVAISAPTTAGGVQATAFANMFLGTVTIAGGGTGYTVGNVLTVVGGTQSTPAQLTVSTVSSGVITGVTISASGFYSVLPTSPVSVTGGSGSGATFNLTAWGVSALSISNAGSGYIEQPTITFSGGGGSGAAAFATVGSGTIVRSLGSTMSFSTPSGEGFRVNDPTGSVVNYILAQGSTTGSGVQLRSAGTDANVPFLASARGTSQFSIYTNTFAQEQLRVSHTASAVNYVQVTGGATTVRPLISVQGSDTNIGMTYGAKGTGIHAFTNGNGTQLVIQSGPTSSVNRLEITPSIAGSAPILSAGGTDTDIDLALTPKGTGRVQFGTRTASADVAITGYIEIKDAGGTVRRLAVVG